MNDVVVDASALVMALTMRTSEAYRLPRRLTHCRRHAPHLVDAEVGHALRRRVMGGWLSPETALIALRRLPETVQSRHPHAGPLSEAAWRMRATVTFYDALYVALAASLDVPLLTCDARLSRAPGTRCRVEVAGLD